jgi:hypothetical protein
MKSAILKTVLIGTMGALALGATGVASANDQKHGARVYVNAPPVYSNYGHGGHYNTDIAVTGTVVVGWRLSQSPLP